MDRRVVSRFFDITSNVTENFLVLVSWCTYAGGSKGNMFRKIIAGLKGLYILNFTTRCQFISKALIPTYTPTSQVCEKFTSPWTLCIAWLLKTCQSVGTKKISHRRLHLHFIIPMVLRVFRMFGDDSCFLWNACLDLCLKGEILISKYIGVFCFHLWFF